MLEQIMSFLTVEFRVLFASMIPIIELRGAIPVGVLWGLSPVHALIVSWIGSMIPVPILLFGIRPVMSVLRKTKLFQYTIERLIHKTLKKSGHIGQYGFWGLILFVGIPLPGTGVWSGTLAAVLLDLRFKTAFPAIAIGNLIAGLIITLMSQGIVWSVGG